MVDLSIGIFTFQNAINIGAFLQAKALSDALLEGCKRNRINGSIVFPFKFNMYDQKYDILSKHPSKFMFNLTRYKKFLEAQKIFPVKKLSRYDIAVFGSDSIWDVSEKTSGYIPNMFGIGVNALTKATYAGSFGTLTNKDLVPEDALISISNMDFINVRDENSYRIAEVVKKDLMVGMDPTIISDLSKYGLNIGRGEYIMIYGEFPIEYQKELLKLRNKMGIPLLSVGTYNCWCDESIPVSPFEFIGYIKNASYIVTSMFHGSILAMLFHKQYVSYFTDKRLTKAYTTFQKMGMTDRLIRSKDDIYELLKTKIDYSVFEMSRTNEINKANVYFDSILQDAINKRQQ